MHSEGHFQWTESKWSHEALENQTVEFELNTPSGPVHGIGEFLIQENPDGLLVVVIRSSSTPPPPRPRRATPVNEPARASAATMAPAEPADYFLSQSLVDKIEPHPDPSVAHFRMFEQSDAV